VTVEAGHTRASKAVARLSERPARYDTDWGQDFHSAIRSRLRDGMSILDVGSGRSPTLDATDRPSATHYVGLDPSQAELDAADAGVYDEKHVADIASRRDSLVGRFDLIVSWQVIEHVKDVEAAFQNMREYLQPGGAMVLMFSGRWSPFALAGRVLPFYIGKPIVSRIMKRSASRGPVFPAYYDKCYDTEMRRLLTGWTAATITPYYRGAAYLNFSALAFRAYLAYENTIAARRVANLATHYMVVAER
jgi:SAM-dependent methyltransferase